MKTENFTFRNVDEMELAARLYYNDSLNEKGVLFSHGLFSSKDGYKITRMAESIVSCGYTLMTFDFTFAGESPGNISDISVMNEVSDLMRAVKAFEKRGVKKIHLMGSSMGAAVSLLTASVSDAPFESMVLIATPLDLPGIIPGMTSERIDSLDPSGYTDFSGVKINNRFFREMRSIDMIKAVKGVKSPVLIFHGGKDEVVEFRNHELLKSNLNVSYSAFVIDDGDHNLTRDSDIEFMTGEIKKWLAGF